MWFIRRVPTPSSDGHCFGPWTRLVYRTVPFASQCSHAASCAFRASAQSAVVMFLSPAD